MSISPPSPLGSTGITVLTLGSARTDTCLTAPVVRSATSADWLSGSMISPLVLSRQPCMTPGAGHSFGNGFAGSGGGGGGVDVGPGASSGSVVNGCDCAESNRAQPAPASNAAHSSDDDCPQRPAQTHAGQVTDCWAVRATRSPAPRRPSTNRLNAPCQFPIRG